VFRNPPGDSAGRLIDSLGLKGMSVGGASVSTVHGNFIVNRGDATAADVLALLDRIKKEVKARSGVQLQEEVILWT
jgi:UDP-N-acetylmuramate dehydrogenase